MPCDMSDGPFEPVRRMAVGPWRVELLPRGPYHAIYLAERPITGFAFDSQVGVHAFSGERRTGFRARPNGLAHVPIGCEVFSRSERGGEYLQIVDGRAHGRAPETRFSDRIDKGATAAAHALRRELLAVDEPDPLACEQLVLNIEERVASVSGQPLERASGGMTNRRLKRVEELIEARLAESLTVQELAAALGLSSGFFSRAFRAATGRTPHAWIVDRRLARARTLLLSGDAELVEIAAECGFASHSHLTARFRAQFGTVPSRFRQRFKSAP